MPVKFKFEEDSMKKSISILLVVMILSLGMSLNADDKELNVMAGLGLSFSDLEGLSLDLGVEKQFTENLYAMFFLSYYFDPTGFNTGGSYYGVNYDVSVTLTALNFAAVYKRAINEKLKWFARAGLLLALSRVKVTGSYMGISLSESESATDFGLAAALGVEYLIQTKIAIVLGAAIDTILGDGSATWFKIFAGINYKLK